MRRLAGTVVRCLPTDQDRAGQRLHCQPCTYAVQCAIENLSRKYARRQVTIATITNNKDNRRVLGRARNSQRNFAGTRCRDTAKNPFLNCHPTRHLFSNGLTDIFDLIDSATIKNLG